MVLTLIRITGFLLATVLRGSRAAPVELDLDFSTEYSSLYNMPSWSTDWTWVDGSASAGFTTDYASHFLCSITISSGSVQIGDTVGISNMKVQFCSKTDSSSSGSQILGVNDPDLGVGETASYSCPSGYFIQMVAATADLNSGVDIDDQGITGLTISCVNPKTQQSYYDSSSQHSVTNVFAPNLNVDREKIVIPEENYFICGVKARQQYTSPEPDGDTIGLLGFKLLYCEYCLASFSSGECNTGTPAWLSVKDEEIEPFYLMTPDAAVAGVQESMNGVTCSDVSSDEGYFIVGGFSKDGALVSTTNHPQTKPWLGLKKQSSAGTQTDWVWMLYDESSGLFGFDDCKISPTIVPSLGKKLVVGLEKPAASGGQHFLIIIDPFFQNTEVYQVLARYELSTMSQVHAALSPVQDVSIAVTVSGFFKLVVTFVHQSETSGTRQLHFTKVIYDFEENKAEISVLTSLASSTALFTTSRVITGGGSYYFTHTHEYSSGKSNTAIVRHVTTTETWDDYTADLASSATGFEIYSLESALSADSFLIIQELAYFDKLVGIMSLFIADPTSVTNLGDAFSFIGQCSTSSYYRLKMTWSKGHANFWAKGLYAKDATTNYAVMADYLSDGGFSTFTYMVKITFDPDTSSCSSGAYNAAPTATFIKYDSFCNPADKCSVTRASYYSPLKAMVISGTTSKISSSEFTSENSIAFIGGLTISKIDAATDSLSNIETTQEFTKLTTAATTLFPAAPTPTELTTTSTTVIKGAAYAILKDFTTPSSCFNKLTSLDSTEYTAGEEHTLHWNIKDTTQQYGEIKWSEVFENADSSACPIQECKLLRYHESNAIYSDPAADVPYDPDMCRYDYSTSSLAMDSTDPANPYMKVTFSAIETHPRVCLWCRTNVDSIKSNVFDLKLDWHPCNYMAITGATFTDEVKLTYDVYYNAEGERFPPDPSNITVVTVDLFERSLITTEDRSKCPVPTYTITQVLKEDMTTTVDSALWSDILSISEEGILSFNNYGDVNTSLYQDLTITIFAENIYKDIDAAANLVKFSISENIYNDPPKFDQPLEPVSIAADVGSKISNEDFEIDLPKLSDPNGDGIASIVPMIPMAVSDVIKFDNQANKFTVKVSLITPEMVELYPVVSVPLTLKDEQGALNIQNLEIGLNIFFPDLQQSQNQTLPGNVTEPDEENEEDKDKPSIPEGGEDEEDTPPIIVIPIEPEEEEEEDPAPVREITKLFAYIDEITTLGRVTLQFNQPIVQNVDVEAVNEDVLDLWVEPGDYEKPENFNLSAYGFTWETEKVVYSDYLVYIQVNFTDAIAISPQVQQDQLFIRIKQRDFFKSLEFDLPVDSESEVLQQNIKKQMPNNIISQTFDAATESTQEAMVASTIFSVVISIFVQGALKELVGTILSLQVIIFMFLFSITFPANTGNFITKLKPIVSFNILKVLSKYTVRYLMIDVDSQAKLRQEIILPAQDIGITSHNSLQNLGNVFHLELLYFFTLAYFILLGASMVCSSKYKEKVMKLQGKLFFTQILQILVGGFIPLSISVYLNMRNPLDTSLGEQLGVVFTWVSASLLCVFLPMALLLVLLVPKSWLEFPGFKQRWGPLYGNVKVETRLQRSYRHIFLLRRLAVLGIGFRMFATPPLQMIAINLMNIAYTVFLGQARPFKTPRENRLDMANEAVVAFATYQIFTFSDALPDPEAQYEIGWSFVGLIALQVLMNAFFVVKGMANDIRLLSLKNYNSLAYKKQKFDIDRVHNFDLDEEGPSAGQMIAKIFLPAPKPEFKIVTESYTVTEFSNKAPWKPVTLKKTRTFRQEIKPPPQRKPSNGKKKRKHSLTPKLSGIELAKMARSRTIEYDSTAKQRLRQGLSIIQEQVDEISISSMTSSGTSNSSSDSLGSMMDSLPETRQGHTKQPNSPELEERALGFPRSNLITIEVDSQSSDQLGPSRHTSNQHLLSSMSPGLPRSKKPRYGTGRAKPTPQGSDTSVEANLKESLRGSLKNTRKSRKFRKSTKAEEAIADLRATLASYIKSVETDYGLPVKPQEGEPADNLIFGQNPGEVSVAEGRPVTDLTTSSAVAPATSRPSETVNLEAVPKADASPDIIKKKIAEEAGETDLKGDEGRQSGPLDSWTSSWQGQVAISNSQFPQS